MSKNKVIFETKGDSCVICVNNLENTFSTSEFNNDDIINADTLEVLNGHEVTLVNKNMYMKEIIVIEGKINFGHYPSHTSSDNKTIIKIGSKGKLSLTGKELPIKEITMESGSEFHCILENYQYKLNANDNIQFNSNYLKRLVQVTNFMQNNFGNKEKVNINYSNTAELVKYQKLCEKIGKKTVQDFINSKKPLITFDSINKDIGYTGFMKKSFVSSCVKKYFPSEKRTIDFKSIDKLIGQFVNNNYFELTGIAKNPLKNGFDEKFGCSIEIIKNISSFLNLNDIISHASNPIEENIEVSGDSINLITN